MLLRPAPGCWKYPSPGRDMICYFTNKWLPDIPISLVLNICINGGIYKPPLQAELTKNISRGGFIKHQHKQNMEIFSKSGIYNPSEQAEVLKISQKGTL